jgi:hypothetical protein
MINFRSLAMIATTAVCLMACGSGESAGNVGEHPADSTGTDSTNVDRMATGTSGGMARDIPNGTGTDSTTIDSTAKKTDTVARKGKWPSQGDPFH